MSAESQDKITPASITDDIANYYYRDSILFQNFHTEIMALHAGPNSEKLKPVAWMKSKLGKQSYMWTGEFRFHVWECSKWRCYVNNEKGICFEVIDGLSAQEARSEWENFMKNVGLSF